MHWVGVFVVVSQRNVVCRTIIAIVPGADVKINPSKNGFCKEGRHNHTSGSRDAIDFECCSPLWAILLRDASDLAVMRGCLVATAPQWRGAFGGVLAAASPTRHTGGWPLARKAIDGGSRHPKVLPQLGEAIQNKHAGCEQAAAWGQWGRQPSDPRPHCAAPPAAGTRAQPCHSMAHSWLV